jgi:hypothetical protein
MKQLAYNLLLLLSLALLFTYSYFWHNNYYPSISELLRNPKQIDKLVELRGGEIVEFHNTEKVFIYQDGNDRIDVKYNDKQIPKKSILGRTSIYGRYENRYIELISIHNNNYNFLKYIVSIIGFIIENFAKFTLQV